MASQTKTSIVDPSQERKASETKVGLSQPWKQFDITPPSRRPWSPPEPKVPSEYDQNFQDLLAQLGNERTLPESKPVEGEIHLGSMTEPADIDLAPAGLEPRIPPLQETSEFNQFLGMPDMLSRAFKVPEPLAPAIRPEEIERRNKAKQASILTLSEQLKNLARGLTQVPIDLGEAGIEGTKYNLRIAAGVPEPTEKTHLNKIQREEARKRQFSEAMGKTNSVEEKATEHLTREMMRAAHDRITAQRRRAEEEEERLAKQQVLTEQADQGDPLAQTGAKKARGLLHMFGAVKKKAQTWFTGLKNKFVQLGQVIKKWLGGEQQAANRQG